LGDAIIYCNMVNFPGNFLWGAATSSHQVEGNNSNHDWWRWEKKTGLKDASGQACRHYELFRQDFDLAKALGHNTHRFSIEWSRIEPREGEFSAQELNHYVDVVIALRERGLIPVVTLHHFTNPVWFADMGGWKHRHACRYFLRYAEKVVDALSDKVHFWMTINEPLVYVFNSYMAGVWPPQGTSLLGAACVTDHMAAAHIRAHRLIHDIYRKKGLPAPAVSIAKNLRAFQACRGTLKNKCAAYLRNRTFNFDFLDRLSRQRSLDYIGVNYYTRDLADVRGWTPRHFAQDLCDQGHDPLPKNSLGWDIYPEGLYTLLVGLDKRYHLPVLISENGICTEDDGQRWEYIRQHLLKVHDAMAAGVKVWGYLYWSLIDNFEWDKSFGPRFGLIEIDYASYERRIRESARKFAAVCKTGTLA
jgi:beta-glucosidase